LIDVPATMIPDFNMQFAVLTNAYDYAFRARLIQQGKHVAYETNSLCSANHNTNKDVSSCVCTQVFVLLSEGYKLHRSSFLSLIMSLIISRNSCQVLTTQLIH
jgi:hypothetical protein